MIRSVLACGLSAALFTPAAIRAGEQPPQAHASHRLAPIALELLQRPVTARTGTGRVHHAAATPSKEAQALYDRGLASLHAFVWIDAARAFNAALRLDPSLALAHAGLSVAYSELGLDADAKQAIAAARAVPALPDHDRRHVDARALQMAAEAAPGNASALAAYRAALDEAIAAYPKDVELMLLRGIAESPDPADRGQGSGAGSIPYYERALAISPGHVAAHHYLAHAHENAGRVDPALEHATAFAKQASDVPHARHMRGHGLRRAGRVPEAIAEFEAADRLHRESAKADGIPLEHDWHFAHNLGLLASSVWHAGQMTRAETLLEVAFTVPTSLLVQAYNKREWPMFLRARGRHADAEAAAKALIADPHPTIQAVGHIELGLTRLAHNRWGEAAESSNAALRLLRTAPGGGLAAPALLALQGEFNLRTAERAKGRATLEDAVRRLRALPGPDPWSQATFQIEAIARTARAVGDWELARSMARHLLEHDPSYAGSHYAMALVAEHDGDAAVARREFALALERWAQADQGLAEAREARDKAR